MISKTKKALIRCAAVVVPMLVAIGAVDAAVPTATIGKNVIKLEVASTPQEIQRGLMYRTSLPEDSGMVFIFHPPREVKFWMAHCFISLDMLFIRDGKILKIAENVPPCKAKDEKDCPTYPDQMIGVSEVVEVNAGYAKRHGIKEGDTITFQWPVQPGGDAAGSGSAPSDTQKGSPQ